MIAAGICIIWPFSKAHWLQPDYYDLKAGFSLIRINQYSHERQKDETRDCRMKVIMSLFGYTYLSIGL